ncbi:MAG: ATP-binding protein, partial [Chloroflexi bacterium]|nr:ATP-binding protein [Chloroflexota bacterium]
MKINPYNPLEPTTDATRFYGRRHAFAFFQRHLAGAINEKALVVLGQRGIGKSSLLSQIPLHIDERYVPIWIDASQLDLDDEIGLIATIVDQTRAAMEAVEASTYRLPDFPDPSEVEMLRWLADDFLDVALTAVRRERHIVMMIDEAQLLFDAVENGTYPRDFFSYLQNLLTKHERLDIVAALDILYEAEAIKTPPLNDTTLHYRLLQLNEKEARLLIQEPVKEMLNYSPA